MKQFLNVKEKGNALQDHSPIKIIPSALYMEEPFSIILSSIYSYFSHPVLLRSKKVEGGFGEPETAETIS